MNNCERCCFFESCTRLGRIENKDCVYGNKNCINGNKADKDKGAAKAAGHEDGNVHKDKGEETK